MRWSCKKTCRRTVVSGATCAIWISLPPIRLRQQSPLELSPQVFFPVPYIVTHMKFAPRSESANLRVAMGSDWMSISTPRIFSIDRLDRGSGFWELILLMWSITFKKIGPIDAFHRIRLTLGNVGAYATIEFMPTMGRYQSWSYWAIIETMRAPYGPHMGIAWAAMGFCATPGP